MHGQKDGLKNWIQRRNGKRHRQEKVMKKLENIQNQKKNHPKPFITIIQAKATAKANENAQI